MKSESQTNHVTRGGIETGAKKWVEVSLNAGAPCSCAIMQSCPSQDRKAGIQPLLRTISMSWLPIFRRRNRSGIALRQT